MTDISWTKEYRTSDKGFVLGGADIGNIQNDITTAVNGSLSDGNLSRNARIPESYFSFNTSTGHRHDGDDSRLTSKFTGIFDKHGRVGLDLEKVDADTIRIKPGSVVIGSTVLTNTASATVDNTNADTASSFVYVYASNNSGTLAFDTSHDAPDLTDVDSNSTGDVFRYKSIGGTIHRCLGGMFNDASQDLDDQYVSNFDASLCLIGKQEAHDRTADLTVTTIWTPKLVYMFGGRTSNISDLSNAQSLRFHTEFFDDSGRNTRTGFFWEIGEGSAVGGAFDEDFIVKSYQSQSSGTEGKLVFEFYDSGADTFDVYFMILGQAKMPKL